MYTYFMFRRKQNTAELGTYMSYDIVVYRELYQKPVQIVRDVSPDGDLVFRMVQIFNRCRLSPLHLMDIIPDMLD